MKKKVIISSCVIVLLLIYVFYPRSFEDQYNRIKIGDTFDRVKTLLDIPDDMLPTLEPNENIYIWFSKERIYSWKYPFIFKTPNFEKEVQITIKDNIVKEKTIHEAN